MSRKARYVREYGKWGLRATHRPQRDESIAGAVLVLHGGRGTVNIHFSQDFVEACGRALPFGVSHDRPAFLRLVGMPRSTRWRLSVRYFDAPVSEVLLVEYESRPSWAKRIKVLETGDESTAY